MWVQTGQADVVIDAGTFQVLPAANSVININKNDIFTTISVIKG